jgi:hypothetical protein
VGVVQQGLSGRVLPDDQPTHQPVHVYGHGTESLQGSGGGWELVVLLVGDAVWTTVGVWVILGLSSLLAAEGVAFPATGSLLLAARNLVCWACQMCLPIRKGSRLHGAGCKT